MRLAARRNLAMLVVSAALARAWALTGRARPATRLFANPNAGRRGARRLRHESRRDRAETKNFFDGGGDEPRGTDASKQRAQADDRFHDAANAKKAAEEASRAENPGGARASGRRAAAAGRGRGRVGGGRRAGGRGPRPRAGN